MPREITAERAALESRRVERVYAVLARVYDDCFDWALGPGRRLAVARLGHAPGRVLEIGVGTGLSLPHYPSNARITGVDISEPMLEQARERAEALGRPVDLWRMDARELEFRDETFDAVLAPYVISVVPEPERVMREICRVCRPGGRVIVVNQFHSENRLAAWIDAALSPLTQWLGFRMDVPVGVVTGTAGLRLSSRERVNPLRLWRLLVLDRV